MSKYTIELRKICEIASRETVESWFKDYDLSDYLTPEEIQVIRDRNTFSEDKLAKRIVEHYYMREIAFETIPLFENRVKNKIKEIMERQAFRIYSASIKYDPLVNVDFTETYDRNINGEGSSNSSSNSSGSGLAVNSDTPQGQISYDKIMEGKYASTTGASESTNNITDSSNTSSNQNEFYTKKVKGNSGVSATAQKMIEQYRQNIIEITNDIIFELKDLFFILY